MDPAVTTNKTKNRSPLWLNVSWGVIALSILAVFLIPKLFPLKPYVSSYSREDYDKAMEGLDKAAGDRDRCYALGRAAKTSVYFGSPIVAKRYADELLELSRTQERTWNFGNAVHDGHEVLGLVALRRGNSDEAAKELLLAGGTPGSPQADTFGPNMLLAKELLEHGDRATVIAYFDLCRKFWEMGLADLDKWTADAREGRTPDFGANLVH